MNGDWYRRCDNEGADLCGLMWAVSGNVLHVVVVLQDVPGWCITSSIASAVARRQVASESLGEPLHARTVLYVRKQLLSV